MARWIERGPEVIEYSARGSQGMTRFRYEYVNSQGDRYSLSPYGAHTEPWAYVQRFMEPDWNMFIDAQRLYRGQAVAGQEGKS